MNPKEKLEAQIKSADMTEDMQQEAIDVAQEGMSKYSIEKVSSVCSRLRMPLFRNRLTPS